ncbi:MAG: 4-hydroxy-tetrahydrodipicolinate reductase [Thermodesulfobacteriota bacterium]|nr:4-hydroxy-tetrahydrodipicolinate reductase [Thermodesulfobacteriota bacterium]
MINTVVAGAAGRMGGRIIQMIQKSGEINLSGAFERPDHPAIGKDVGQIVGLGNINMELTGDINEAMENADVLIDFTAPESTLENIRFISKAGQAIIIGTTGITDEINQELNLLSQKIRCVMSPNMSVGVNVLFKTVNDLSKILNKGYDMEIIEYHHRLKKDAPSGTAMHLAKILADSTGRNLDTDAVYKRKGFIGVRRDEEIGIQSIRAGDIVGEHTTIFAGVGERIEITHRAHSRDNFARGALLAATWVVKQPNGLYDMQDVLGLKENDNV